MEAIEGSTESIAAGGESEREARPTTAISPDELRALVSEAATDKVVHVTAPVVLYEAGCGATVITSDALTVVTSADTATLTSAPVITISGLPGLSPANATPAPRAVRRTPVSMPIAVPVATPVPAPIAVSVATPAPAPAPIAAPVATDPVAAPVAALEPATPSIAPAVALEPAVDPLAALAAPVLVAAAPPPPPAPVLERAILAPAVVATPSRPRDAFFELPLGDEQALELEPVTRRGRTPAPAPREGGVAIERKPRVDRFLFGALAFIAAAALWVVLAL